MSLLNKALILHGTNSSSKGNWFPWTQAQLENLGYQVWAPDLPGAERPNIEQYNKFLLSDGWNFNGNLMVGHSSGSVAILGLLQALPETVKAGTVILIGTFRGSLGRDDLKGVDIEFDYEKIKQRAEKFLVIHSDNDPYCPLEGAQWIAKKLDAEFILLPGQAHFSRHQMKKFSEFPKLIEIIKQKVKV